MLRLNDGHPKATVRSNKIRKTQAVSSKEGRKTELAKRRELVSVGPTSAHHRSLGNPNNEETELKPNASLSGGSWSGSTEYAGSLIWAYRAGDGRGGTSGVTSELSQDLGLVVEEGDRRSSNQLVDGTISGVVDQRLGVGGDPKSDRASDTRGDDAL